MDEQKKSDVIIKITGIIMIGIIMIVAILQSHLFPTQSSMEFVGQGRATIKPDIALLNLGIATFQAKTPEQALDQTTEKTNKIISILQEFGIPEKDRQITLYSFNISYKDLDKSYLEDCGDSEKASTKICKDKKLEKTPKISGYNGFQRITIKVRGIDKDFAKINRLIKLVAEQGVYDVGAAELISSDTEKAKQEARTKSIIDAKNRATEMSRELGIKLEKISGIYERVLMSPFQGYNGGGNENPTITFPNENNQISVFSFQPADPTEIIVETSVTYYIK